MIPYIRTIVEGVQVQEYCDQCLSEGKKEILVRFGSEDSHKLICRACGKVTIDDKFECCACQRDATLIVCTQGKLSDTTRFTYYCEPCFTNIVTEWI